jgi:hypothetical protein
MQFGNANAESSGNAGSDFSLDRYNDAGTFIDSPITITRSTGQLTLTQPLNLPADPTSALQAATKQYVDGRASITTPTVQTFTSGSGTYTTPAGVKWLEITLVGGGAGGSGGNGGGTGTAGGNTTFGTSFLSANGAGANSAYYIPGTPGLGSGGSVLNIYGGFGSAGGVNYSGGQGGPGGSGGASSLGGNGGGSFNAAGNSGVTNSGSGGGGGGVSAVAAVMVGGAGGSAGGTCRHVLSSPAATYSYAVGAGGTGGAAGTNGSAGGNGAAGIIIVIEHYDA